MTDPAPLVVDCIPRLRRYARALTVDRDRADELVQDTLERAWSRIHLWQPSGDMRAWLFTIMHNVFVNTARAYSRQPTWVEITVNDAPTSADAEEDHVALQELRRAIDDLPVSQREVVLLIALEELSYEEVAGVLDIPVGTVMSRLSRGRDRLRTAMRDDAESPPTLRSVK